MMENSFTELKRQIRSYENAKIICISVGIAIAVLSIFGIIALSIYSTDALTKATDEYLASQGDSAAIQKYDEVLRLVNLAGIGITVLSLTITGGIALAVAGGIVNSCKARNRRSLLRKKKLAEDYGGNGVEY